MNWRNYKLEDLGEFKNGVNFSTDKMGKGLPLINVKDITNSKFLNSSKMDLVDLELKGSTESYLAKVDDVFFVRSSVKRDGVGMVGMLASFEKEVIHCGFVIRFRPTVDFVSPKFLLYLLSSPLYRERIKNLSSGATIVNISQTSLKKLEVQIPPVKNQKRITSILSAYDDLIENNRKRIKLLEETTQNIYKEWFVNFRFPNYENALIDQVTGLPEGWEVKTIAQFGTVITGKTPSTSNDNFFGGKIPFVKTPDMHDAAYVMKTNIYLSHEGAESQNNKFLPKNSVMVTCIGSVGVVSLTSENCQTNQQINSVKFDNEYKSFYFFCFAKGLKTLLEGLGSNGATMVNVNKSKFENIEIVFPRENLLNDYHNLVSPIFNQILVLQVYNQKLKEARDILLPRLLNRTIEV